MTKYLVTGAAGYLGYNIVQALLERSADVRSLVLPNDPVGKQLEKTTEVVYGDMLKDADLERFFDVDEGVDVIVIHCAGVVTMAWGFEQRVYDINVTGTKNILRHATQHQVKKLVYVSSVHAIKDLPQGQQMSEPERFYPEEIVGFYGKTKAEASQAVMDAVKEQGLNASIVFPSGICGPGDYAGGQLSQVFIEYFNGRVPVGIEGGYSFVDVRDAADGVIRCVEKGERGRGYIMSAVYITVRDLLRLVSKHTSLKEVKHMMPVKLAWALLPVIRLYYKLSGRKALFSRYAVYTLGCNGNFSSQRAMDELGLRFRPFEETVVDTIAWLRKENKVPQ